MDIIEIPFGAKDSELKGWEYTIPEGMEAVIENGKIIVRQKDSDDERIRKHLIALVRKHTVNHERCQMEAYLEKQKEQKPEKWSEEYREEDLRTRFAFYTYKDEDGVLYLSNVFVEETSRNKGFGTKILQAAEKVAETIGATTIRLKVKEDSPADVWYRKNGYSHMKFEDGYDWLEKNLEYMKPAKQEWSEKDGEMIVDIIRYLEVQKEDRDAPFFDLAISFLKSICPPFKDREMKLKILKYLSTRCSSLEFEEVENYLNNLSLSWKPSEDHMEALKYFIGPSPMGVILADLYDKLEELK